MRLILRSKENGSTCIELLIRAAKLLISCCLIREILLRQNTSFRKAIKRCYEVPLTINTDNNPNYPQAIDELKREGVLSPNLEHLQVKYLNNIIESDHRRVKRRTRPMIRLQSFKTANLTLKGVEAMAMMIKQQSYYLKTSLQDQIKFVNELFGVYA